MSGPSPAIAADISPVCRPAIVRNRHPVHFEVEGCVLHGMLDLPPRGVPRRTMGVLLLNSDDGCRLGPYNLWIRLTDRLTADGFPCMRFDYRGCGDSEGPEGSPSGVVGLKDTMAAERVFRTNADIDSVLLVGICYGAEIALLAARCLPSVGGIVACSTGKYVTNAGYGRSLREARQYAGRYLDRLATADAWRRLVRGQVHPGIILQGLLQRLSWKRRRSDRQGAVAAEALASKGVHLVPQLFIYGGADPLTGKCMPDYRAEGDRNAFDRRFMIVPEADHNFASMIWSGQVIEAVIAFVGEIGRMAEEGRRGNARIG